MEFRHYYDLKLEFYHCLDVLQISYMIVNLPFKGPESASAVFNYETCIVDQELIMPQVTCRLPEVSSITIGSFMVTSFIKTHSM